MEIRPAVPDDAEALRAIYNPVVLTSTATFDLVPRTQDEQRRWISDRSGARLILVAVEADEVLGFAAISPYRDRAAYATTVEDSVYIREDHHGEGVGKALLGAIVEATRAHGFHTMIARIVSDHQASIRLHETCGFEKIGLEKQVGRKFGRWLDVVVMQKML